jgi:hypothetical protein
MSFKTLGEALESALASALNGEEGAPTPSVSRKKTGAVDAPGDCVMSTQPATKATSPVNGRCEPTQIPSALPPRRVGSHLRLVVVNERGSGPAQGGGRSPGRLRCGGEEVDPAREWLKLVHHASSV